MVLYCLGCPIPVADDPKKVVIPKGRTPDKVIKNLSFVMEDEISSNGSQSTPLFGGHKSWKQREESFRLKPTMKVRLLSHSLPLFCVASVGALIIV